MAAFVTRLLKLFSWPDDFVDVFLFTCLEIDGPFRHPEWAVPSYRGQANCHDAIVRGCGESHPTSPT